MCGIVGATSTQDITAQSLAGLKLLEYRGYDSAGLGWIDPKTRTCAAIKVPGKVGNLIALSEQQQLRATLAIAHTRWATHGQPSPSNAHPQLSQHATTAIVHNGIIENHQDLRQNLQSKGVQFTSDTDSEVICQWIEWLYQDHQNVTQAITQTLAMLTGSFAIAIIHRDHPQSVFLACHGSPLVISHTQHSCYFASDPLALISHCQSFIYLKSKQLAHCRPGSVTLTTLDQHIIKPTYHTLTTRAETMIQKDFVHYMLDEIHQQPTLLERQLQALQPDSTSHCIDKTAILALFDSAEAIHLVACGSSYFAACVGRQWIEASLKISCQCDVASEYRYRRVVTPPKTLMIVISQSGETADTIAAMRSFIDKNDSLGVLALTNVENSTIAREADAFLPLAAGPEIGVASTKAFTAQLLALFALSTRFFTHNPTVPNAQLMQLSQQIQTICDQSDVIKSIAMAIQKNKQAIFLGRGLCYPIAQEGALKLKETAYIHSHAYPMGELKHGPLALIEPNLPVIALVPDDDLLTKTQSNLQEIHCRQGRLIVILSEGVSLENANDFTRFIVPKCHPDLAPFLFTLPLQLLAYHTAHLNGHDVDQPRNLAKCVTVE